MKNKLPRKLKKKIYGTRKSRKLLAIGIHMGTGELIYEIGRRFRSDKCQSKVFVIKSTTSGGFIGETIRKHDDARKQYPESRQSQQYIKEFCSQPLGETYETSNQSKQQRGIQ